MIYIQAKMLTLLTALVKYLQICYKI